MQKPVTFWPHGPLVKCRTCSQLGDIKRHKTLSSVFCLTAPFFFLLFSPQMHLHFTVTLLHYKCAFVRVKT